jgi:hypothetical protein
MILNKRHALSDACVMSRNSTEQYYFITDFLLLSLSFGILDLCQCFHIGDYHIISLFFLDSITVIFDKTFRACSIL